SYTAVLAVIGTSRRHDRCRKSSVGLRVAMLERSFMVICAMAHDLDDIKAQSDCPVCGTLFNVSYRTLRLNRTIECQGCGETIRPIDETPIGKLQDLIDEVSGKN